MADLNEELRKMIADEEASVLKTLKESGYVKAVEEEPTVDLSDCEEPEDYALAAGRHLFRTCADKWTQLLNNNGLNNEETERAGFLRQKDDLLAQPRNLIDAMEDLDELFKMTYEEVADDIKEATGMSGRDIRDTMSRIQFPQIMQRVVELPMMEPIEPAYVLQGLFKSMSLPGMVGDQVTFKFPILGGIEAADMGEDAETIEKEINLTGGSMVTKFAKIGVGFKYSSDFDRFANFDWFNLLTSACRQALARERELRAYDHISGNGSTVIDNRGRFGFTSSTAAAGTVGSAGTGIDGLHNGTHVLQDLFYMMADFNDDGLFPDTVVLSPRAWLIWAQSPEMRAFAWQHGQPQLWQMPQGRRGWAEQHQVEGGLLGPSSDYPRGSTQYTTPPNHLPLNLRIVVSPFVNNGTDDGIEYTDAHVLDVADGIGYIIENQPVTLTEWIDMAHDMRNIRFKERYAYGVLQDSETIRHMRYLKTREIGVDARDRLMYNVSWAGGVGGPEVGNPS